MVRKFSVNCDFGGQMSPFTIHIGKPEPKHHPLHFQADWLNKERGGIIPGEVMEAVTKLQSLADENNVPLEDLCVYALGTEEEKAEMDAQSGLDNDDDDDDDVEQLESSPDSEEDDDAEETAEMPDMAPDDE